MESRLIVYAYVYRFAVYVYGLMAGHLLHGIHHRVNKRTSSSSTGINVLSIRITVIKMYST